MLLLPSRAKRKRAFSARRKGLRLRLRPPTPGRALRVVQVSSGDGLQAHVRRSGAVPSDDHYDNTVREDPRRSKRASRRASSCGALSAVPPRARTTTTRRRRRAPYSSGVGDGRVVRGTTVSERDKPDPGETDRLVPTIEQKRSGELAIRDGRLRERRHNEHRPQQRSPRCRDRARTGD